MFITQGPEGEQAPYGASKTNWKFLVIVIVLAVVAGGGVLWCKTKQEVPPSPEIKIPGGVKSETANWQTYRNEEYGFEIKYPKDWIVSYEGGPIYISSQRSDIPLRYGNVEISIHMDRADLELFFRKRVDPSWFEDMVAEKDITINNTIKAKEQTFNGPRGKFKAVLIPITKDLFPRFFPGVYLPKDTQEVDSVIQLCYLEPEFEQIFNQMLSTFMFLE